MIKARNITKSFTSGKGWINVIQDISFSVETGATMAIIGKSGSGKSTLLHIMGGLLKPDKGKLSCFGHDIYSLSNKNLSIFLRNNVGFVFQSGNLLSYLTVYENISFPLFLNGYKKKEIEKRVKSLLERIDMPDAEKSMPNELSGGETQRVSLARAMAHSPKMLLADEPTASLDTSTGLKLIELMVGLGTLEGCTTIMATHDNELIKLVDTTLNIQDGRITN